MIYHVYGFYQALFVNGVDIKAAVAPPLPLFLDDLEQPQSESSHMELVDVPVQCQLINGLSSGQIAICVGHVGDALADRRGFMQVIPTMTHAQGLRNSSATAKHGWLSDFVWTPLMKSIAK